MFSQMNLFPDQGKIFRPIHYLGSKLRMIDHLEQIIDEVDPSKGRVYDLFSGSGTVSAYLNRNR
ncbi:TPA: DNA adenine methylase, partial [Enterococcus faecium]